MKLILSNIEDSYETENLIRLFFPDADFKSEDGDFVRFSKKGSVFEAEVLVGGKQAQIKREAKDDFQSFAVLYDALKEVSSRNIEWGLLTGVRPIKLVLDLINKGLSEDEIFAVLENKYKLSSNKANLSYKTAVVEKDILNKTNEKDISLYVGIPFCPTRCSYCSFVCEGIERHKDLVPKYVSLLSEEIKITAEIINRLGLNLKTVYVGGGTPTSLEAEELKNLLQTINESTRGQKIAEFTVEAGRPDTITLEKLLVLKEMGVGRISINPQTLNDDILKTIGRHHTVEQFYESFYLAESLNAFQINVDLIAGLPKDSEESFKNTIEKTVSLNPANITLHTLTLKRSSDIYLEKDLYSTYKTISERVKAADEYIMKNGYHPYYLYRQKNTIGGLENTGFSKKGAEGLYNIFIMDESQSILACGAGASSKAVGKGGKIVRSFNYKYPLEYIKNFSQVENRKKNFEKELKNYLQK